MQLLRVASTMSYQGSLYSGPGDDYDFEDDGYDDLDEFREREDSLQPPAPAEDSDEDTEEANKLASFKKQLQQLEDGSHPELLRRVKRLEHQLHERLRVNRIYKDHMNEVVEREYIAEKKAAAKEFEEKKVELRENLLNDFEDKRKMIENERHSMELNGDSMETATETRVEDGKLLYERRWYHRGQSVSVEGREMPKFAGHIHAITDDAVSLYVLYERRWYHRGQSVSVEGREMPKFAGLLQPFAPD
ncbi:putative suppressor of defective silencing [Operophtera brumata]|uniref:Putative suppressor of defective silencing n=1 Tax=Operophtera brumata TaxID=104452 RepID=A0A0L7LIJ0_OPEBR|nr:putative suppressor of defective silencing [Operophtera brumata]